MAEVRTACPYCGVGCGIVAQVTGDRSVSIAGDPDHPANRGKLCSKGTHLGETVGLEGRLLYPEVNGARASWDVALDMVARGFAETIAQHGPDSVAFYVSGQLLTEDYYAANKLMKGYIGSANIDTNSRLCMASAVAAHSRAFGEDVVPVSYDDLDAAELILLVGSNTAWCHPVIWQRIEAAREARGTKLVVIDPRRTETADQADLFVPVAPDGDTALFNALLLAMRARGLIDQAYIDQHVVTPAGFWAALDEPDDGQAHGVDDAVFAALVDLLAAHPAAITLFSQGANQSIGGTDKGNAIINLHLATGSIGKAGAGPFSITGQPNAMGGREVGGLASMLACHLGFSDEHRAAAQGFWASPAMAPTPGLKAVDLFKAVHDGRVKALWIMATNPAVSMSDAGFVREALARCPLVVVSDVIADTDTSRFAHVRLPALAWGEKDGTVTNSERRISRQRPLLAPPGEARADWAIIADVAARMGHKAAFTWDGPGAVFREYAAMTALARDAGLALDLTALADPAFDYDAMQPAQWGDASPFADGDYSTPNRKARLVSVRATPVRAVSSDWPLRLNTGRYRDQWHTMTRTGLSPRLSQHRREPVVEAHPADAARHALSDGGLARVQTPQGASIFRVQVTDRQQVGALFVPMHWTANMSSGGRTGLLSAQAIDPLSGQPGFKNSPATIVSVTPAWRAFLVTRSPADMPDDMLYWTRARISEGWLYELAGDGTIDTAALLGGQAAMEVGDDARGMRRLVRLDADGRLAAALYVTRNGELPLREWIVAQLASDAMPAAQLLAARPGGDVPDTGPMVCVCFGVGEPAIVEAITAGAADSVAAVGAATCAGTNCGSCRPLIASLIATHRQPAEEFAE
jgi:assimilatory nitrate reductase catalytic subunit